MNHSIDKIWEKIKNEMKKAAKQYPDKQTEI